MNTSHELFRLIDSMTVQEKRYFKLSASFYSKQTGSACVQLFEIINGMPDKSDKALSKAVQKKAYATRLPSLKTELTELLLDSLSAFHTGQRAAFTIRRMVTQAELLYTKGLYTHCLKLLKRAEKKAKQTEQHTALLDILALRRSLLIIKQLGESFGTDMDQLYGQIQQTLRYIQSTIDYRKLMDRMQVVSSQYVQVPAGDVENELTDILGNPLLLDEESTISFDAYLARYSTLGISALLIGNGEQARRHYAEAIDLWKKRPHLIADRISQYRRYLFNYLNCLIALPYHDDFATTIRDIQTLPPQTTDIRLGGRCELWYIELLYYLNRGRLEQGGIVVQEIQQNLSEEIQRSDPLTVLALYYNCSIWYFFTGRYTSALEYLNKLLGAQDEGIKSDMYSFARELAIILHYELGNIDILDAMIRSVQRFFKKTTSAGEFHRIVLHALKALLTCVDRTEEKKVFLSLRRRLLIYLYTPGEPEPPGLLEALLWVTAKLDRRSLQDTVVELLGSSAEGSSKEIFPRE